MSSNETAAYKIMRSLDVDYVLIIFGGVIGYSGDDINKETAWRNWFLLAVVKISLKYQV